MNMPQFLDSMLSQGEKELKSLDQEAREKRRTQRARITAGILTAFPEDFREYVRVDFREIGEDPSTLKGRIEVCLEFPGIAPVVVRLSRKSLGSYEIGWPGYFTYGVPAIGSEANDWQYGYGLTRWFENLEPALALGRRLWQEMTEKYGQEPVYTAPEEPA